MMSSRSSRRNAAASAEPISAIRGRSSSRDGSCAERLMILVKMSSASRVGSVGSRSRKGSACSSGPEKIGPAGCEAMRPVARGAGRGGAGGRAGVNHSWREAANSLASQTNGHTTAGGPWIGWALWESS